MYNQFLIIDKLVIETLLIYFFICEIICKCLIVEKDDIFDPITNYLFGEYGRFML